MRAVLAAVLAVLLLPAAAHAERYGTSADGRALTVERVGDPAAPAAVLVTGSIHGNETAGHAVIARLRATDAAGRASRCWTRAQRQPRRGRRAARARTPAGSTSTATSRAAGAAAGAPFDTLLPRPQAGSEPETRALHAARAARCGRRSRSTTTRRSRWSNLAGRRRPRRRAHYARRSGCPRAGSELPRDRDRLAEPAFPGTSAFVVELPAGALSGRAAARHARAVLALAASRARGGADAAEAADRLDPDPVRRQGRRQMRRYSPRHYGDAQGQARSTRR